MTALCLHNYFLIMELPFAIVRLHSSLTCFLNLLLYRHDWTVLVYLWWGWIYTLVYICSKVRKCLKFKICKCIIITPWYTHDQDMSTIFSQFASSNMCLMKRLLDGPKGHRHRVCPKCAFTYEMSKRHAGGNSTGCNNIIKLYRGLWENDPMSYFIY